MYKLLIVGAAIALTACSSVGPGLANHPIDCAVGFGWADCLPGTAGYANGHPYASQPPVEAQPVKQAHRWLKPKTDYQGFLKDRYSCVQEARLTDNVGQYVSKSMFVSCMSARNYVQDESGFGVPQDAAIKMR